MIALRISRKFLPNKYSSTLHKGNTYYLTEYNHKGRGKGVPVTGHEDRQGE